jgi:hypothetical protein
MPLLQFVFMNCTHRIQMTHQKYHKIFKISITKRGDFIRSCDSRATTTYDLIKFMVYSVLIILHPGISRYKDTYFGDVRVPFLS